MTGIGRYALFLALASAIWSAAVGYIGARRGHPEATRTAEGGLRPPRSLFYALVTCDFSLEHVASCTSRSLSIFYT